MHRLKLPTNIKTWKSPTFTKYITTLESGRSILTSKDIPRPKSLPIFGTNIEFIAAGGGSKLHEYADKRHQQLGPIFCEKLGNTDIVFISDSQIMKLLFVKLEGKYPVHILPDPWVLYEKLYGSKRGLFFMDGEEWLSNRRIMNRYLLREDADKCIENSIKQVIDNFINKWRTKAEQGSISPNIEAELYRLSIDVIMAVLLGKETPLYKKSHHQEELLRIFSESVKKIFQTTTKLYALPLYWCYRLNLKPWRNFKESVDMSLMLAQKLVNEMSMINGSEDGLMYKLKQENISQEDITRIIADFIIAAGDTTAYTMLWTLYLLSENENVVNEIRLKDVTYAKYVLKESMRLYPVAPFLTRILPKDALLGPYKLIEETPIVASIYTSGRNEEYFSQAEHFLPYRWDRNDPRKKELKNFESSASLPFSLGARSCIGRKIALVQLTELIKQVIDNFDLKCTNTVKVNAVTSQVLVPDKDINLTFTLRKP